MPLRHLIIDKARKLSEGGHVFPVHLGVPPDYNPRVSVGLRTHGDPPETLEIDIRWQNETADTRQYILLVVTAAFRMLDTEATIRRLSPPAHLTAPEKERMTTLVGRINSRIRHRDLGVLLNEFDGHIHEGLNNPPPLLSSPPPPREYPPDTGNPYQSPGT